jgi:V-type H+-transporting ATPase subunit a
LFLFYPYTNTHAALRLAWVESFSKFAEFGGWPFAPFSFKQQLEDSEELKEYLG